MKLFKEIFLVIFTVSALAEDFPEEDDVIVLTQANFDQALSSFQNILVEFYAPWCGPCQQFAPEYAEAAKLLKAEGSKVPLAKVDATVELDLASKYEVKGYPTIKFFQNGKPLDYPGGRSPKDIRDWVNWKTGPFAKMLSTAEEVDQFITSSEAVAIGYLSDFGSKPAKAFIEAVSDIFFIPIGVVIDEGVTKAVDAEQGSIVVYKKFDDGKAAVYSGEFNADDIREFIETEQLPLFCDPGAMNTMRIYGVRGKMHLYIFHSASDKTATDVVEAARTAAKDFKNKVVFVSINTDLEDNSNMAQSFDITEDDYPCARLFQFGIDMEIYVPEFSELTAENIKTFLTDYFDGKIKPFRHSEEIPKDWDSKPVKVLVGKNFWDVVKNGEKDVFVQFYDPDDEECNAFAPIWETLAERFADSADFMIAKINIIPNEVDGVIIREFPALKYFNTSNPENPVDYTGGLTLDELTQYLLNIGLDGDTEHHKCSGAKDYDNTNESKDGSGEKVEGEATTKEEL